MPATLTELEELVAPDDVLDLWAVYDAAEQRAWAEYARCPDYLSGRRYARAEAKARERCERDVRHARFGG